MNRFNDASSSSIWLSVYSSILLPVASDALLAPAFDAVFQPSAGYFLPCRTCSLTHRRIGSAERLNRKLQEIGVGSGRFTRNRKALICNRFEPQSSL